MLAEPARRFFKTSVPAPALARLWPAAVMSEEIVRLLAADAMFTERSLARVTGAEIVWLPLETLIEADGPPALSVNVDAPANVYDCELSKAIDPTVRAESSVTVRAVRIADPNVAIAP